MQSHLTMWSMQSGSQAKRFLLQCPMTGSPPGNPVTPRLDRKNTPYLPLSLAGEGRGEAEAEGDPLASGPLASGYDHRCFSPSLPLFPLRPPPIRIFLWMGCRKAADLAEGPPSAVILISILKSGSGIPTSLIYVQRCGTLSSPRRGEEIKRFYFLRKIFIAIP